MKPFGCDLYVVVDSNTDILKQTLRNLDEVGIDAGGVSREFFHLLMERLKD